ncbi:hypothetical protein QEJ31_01485 [Pigmentibacter sp. JX0631]|uniref:hypothetical protein n=1 Tax=Pigmentibacter sp. JX0631 TaxID=2976982 RepID=UPI00246860E3|nr:hypothetical protein [Pigmentibacter sp. JX0631]WGL60277.1 hypothetical protein QEJ31_01485 [Pigmentibacter sp. JX0631]
MGTFETIGVEYNKIKEVYLKYIKAYKDLNNNSTKGATSFADFYLYRTYTSKYADPRKFMGSIK